MPDPLTTTVFGLGIGDVLSMALFLVDQARGRKTAQDILRELKDGAVIRDYIEWLRRRDHQKLIADIGAGREALLAEIGRLGIELHGLVAAIHREIETKQRDLIDRLLDLNQRFQTPVLSPIPLRRRPLVAVPLMGRDQEMAWLVQRSGDAVVSGQPGSGKTFLLFHYGRQNGGMFILTEDPDVAVKAVLSGCPPTIFVDDAANKKAVIQRLFHARQEHGLRFRLILVCWPFELEDLIAEARVPRSEVLQLDLIGRKTIAELVKSVIKDAGKPASDDVVREINNQAQGRPGLAVDLTIACLQDDIQSVMRGDALAKQISQFYGRIAGPRATPVLAAFAIGGKAGMDMKRVADQLGMPIADVYAITKNMAPGGVLEEVSQGRLSTRPAALRRTLLKEVFFNPTKASLPVWQALFENAPDKNEALRTILDAAHVGATVTPRWLRAEIEKSGNAEVWASYAWLGKEYCEWILDKHPEQMLQVVDAALYHLPARTIPLLLDQAVNDRHPLNAHPEAPLRKLIEWITHVPTGNPAVVNRRRILFEAAADWLHSGGDYAIALSAMGACFQLGFEYTESDPGDGMTITISSGLLAPTEIAEVAKLWAPFLDILKTRGIARWQPILSILYGWLRPRNRFGKDPEIDFRQYTHAAARQMIEELIGLCGAHNGFLRWAYTHAQEVGLEPETIPVSAEYLPLYPPERFDKGWEEEEKRQLIAADQLAASWTALPHAEVVARLTRYEAEAGSMESSWPRYTANVCRKVAAAREVTSSEVAVMLDAGLPADVVEPYVLRALDRREPMDAILRRCMADERYRWMVVHHVLMRPILHLMDDVEPLLVNLTHMLDHLGLVRPLAEEVMKRLFAHPEPNVRLAAALCEFRSDREGRVRNSLREAWRASLLAGISEKKRLHDLRNIHDLRQIVEYDRTLAFDLLSAMISRDPESASLWDVEAVVPLVGLLSRDERKRLIDQSGSLIVTDLVGLLVGDDLDLYAHLLSRKNLKSHHLKPLAGDPGKPHWPEKAILAMEARYSAQRVAHAVHGSSWGWSGRASTMWQGWIEKFNGLQTHEDPRIREVGQAGAEWATAEKDRALREERYEDIYGRFGT